MAPYPDNFDGAKFDRLYGVDDPSAVRMPTITQPIGYESVTDYPDPNISTTVGMVWDGAYGCFFLDFTERKIGRRVDEIAEFSFSRDGLRRFRDLANRVLGDRT
jgi:hypothetical protein